MFLYKRKFKEHLANLPETKIKRLYNAYKRNQDETYNIDRINTMKASYAVEKEKARLRKAVRKRSKTGSPKSTPPKCPTPPTPKSPAPAIPHHRASSTQYEKIYSAMLKLQEEKVQRDAQTLKEQQARLEYQRKIQEQENARIRTQQEQLARQRVQQLSQSRLQREAEEQLAKARRDYKIKQRRLQKEQERERYLAEQRLAKERLAEEQERLAEEREMEALENIRLRNQRRTDIDEYKHRLQCLNTFDQQHNDSDNHNADTNYSDSTDTKPFYKDALTEKHCRYLNISHDQMMGIYQELKQLIRDTYDDTTHRKPEREIKYLKKALNRLIEEQYSESLYGKYSIRFKDFKNKCYNIPLVVEVKRDLQRKLAKYPYKF